MTEIVLAHEKLYKDLFSVWANNNLSFEDDDRFVDQHVYASVFKKNTVMLLGNYIFLMINTPHHVILRTHKVFH